MNFKYDGVMSLFYSQRSQLVYCGGEDGSILVRLRRVEPLQDGIARPVSLAEARLDPGSKTVTLLP